MYARRSYTDECNRAVLLDVPTLMSATGLHCETFQHWKDMNATQMQCKTFLHWCITRRSYTDVCNTDAMQDIPILMCATDALQDAPTLKGHKFNTAVLQNVPTLKGHKLNPAVLQNVPTLKTHECTTLKGHQLPFQRHAKAKGKTSNLGRQVYRLTHNPICLKKHLLGYC